MTHSTWMAIKQSNRFYINSYRVLGIVLGISGIINILLVGGIYWWYFSESDSDFYATNGETPPIMLTALKARNYSSTPLLDTDADSKTEAKLLPN